VKKPKILIYDVENTPNLGYSWGKYEQDIIRFTKEWELLSVAYKWLGEKEVRFVSRQGRVSDERVAKTLHQLFSEADIVVAHNGDKHDQRKAKARMIFHGLTPPKILTSIDTRKVARTYFGFNSNSLDDLCQLLKLGKKLKTPGFDLWEGCMADDAKSWRTMERYNKRDVVLLEKLYKKLLPWIQNHPNLGKLLNPHLKSSCPNCGSSHTQRRGRRITAATIKQEWGCRQCFSRFLTPLPKEAK
jgi:ssDNA-binding Zn-finger/Zn-ribbon topoisomerase 1